MIITKEYSTVGKRQDQKENEDGLLIRDEFVAVIDGVTSKGSIRWNNKSSGRFAKDILLEYLERLERLPKRPYDFFRNLNNHLYKEVMNYACSSKNETIKQKSLSIEEYPRANLIILNNQRGEIWNYGDCQCLINGRLFSHEKNIDKINAEIRSAIDMYLVSNHYISLEELAYKDPGRDAISGRLIEQLYAENQSSPNSYPVINGYSYNPQMIKVYHIENDSSIVLATDGYPVLCESLKESETALSVILKKDPMCIDIFTSTKGKMMGSCSFDDRTYWRGHWNQAGVV